MHRAWRAIALFLAAAAPTAAASELLGCPDLPYPEGVDAGPQSVQMRLRIATDGTVAEVAEVDGHPAFIKAAAEAATGCTFEAPEAEQWLDFQWDFAAPAIQIEGIVRARGTQRPVTGLQILVGELALRTADDGSFEVRGLAPGSYQVQIPDARWNLPQTEVEVASGVRLEIELLPVEEQLRGAEVVAVYQRRGATTVRTVSADEIRAMPGTMGDPVRALQSRPGLARTPFEAGWLLVRGGDFDHTGLYLDGVRIPLLYHLGGFTSVLHPELTQEVRFYPGVPPTRYGDGISGAADVIPARLDNDTRVVAGVNTVFAHAFASAPLPRDHTVAMAARRSYIDGILSAVLGPEAARIAPRFWDGQLAWEHRRARAWAIALSDSFDAPTSEGEVVTVTQTGVQSQARIDWEDTILRAWVATHRRSLEGDRAQALLEVFPGARLEHELSAESVRAVGGLVTQHHLYELTTDGVPQGTTGQTLDPYVDIDAKWSVLRLRSGIRLHTLWVTGHPSRAGLSPRAGGELDVAEGLRLILEAGRVIKPPRSALLAALPDGAYLQMEQADTMTLGTRFDRGKLGVGVDVWTRRMAHMAAFEYDGSVGQFIGTGRGLEVTLDYQAGPIDTSVLYQLSEVLRAEDSDDPLEPWLFDQPHRLELLTIVDLPKNWLLSSRFRYSSGFPKPPDPLPTPEAEAAVALDFLTNEEIPLATWPGDRLPPFSGLDVKISRQFTFDRWRLDAWLDVQNVYNARAPEPVITGFGEPLPSYGVGLPILPIFGVEGVFWPSKP